VKKLTNLLLLIVLTIIPFASVSAFEIACDEGIHEFESFFNCNLIGANTEENYDTLSGTITNNEYVNCLRYTDGVGLSNNNSTDNKAFSYIGKPTTNAVSTFRCQVIKKAEEAQRVQIFINDFKSHTKSQIGSPTEEIVRSNYINVAAYVEKTTSTSTKPRDTSNSNSRLKALAEENLNITFSGFITEYNAEVLYEVERLNIKALPFNSNANVRIVGSQTLNVGLNVIDIYVTSPDGASTTCYTLNITRLKEGESVYYPESDSSLKNLTVTGFTIGFKPEVSEYKIHLDNQTNKVEVNAIPNVDKATVNISNTSNLTNGSVITINIISEDLTSETKYRIIITKDAPKKDYTPYIILGVLGILGILVIVIIIYTNKKNKKDPLLRLKNDKRKVNRGKKANQNTIPEAESTILPNPEQQSVNANNSNQVPPNVIKADSVNVVAPMQMTEKPADSNLNKITTNANSLDLNISAKAMPQAITTPVVNPNMGEINTMQPAPTQINYQPSQQPVAPQPQIEVAQPVPVNQVGGNSQIIQSVQNVPTPNPQIVNTAPINQEIVQSPPVPPVQIISNPEVQQQSQDNSMIDLGD